MLAKTQRVTEKPLLQKFTTEQKVVVGILAFLQFTIILDFMILSPLGAILIPALSISTQQFGLVVSAYAFSAGASGLLAAGFADRFDRKKLLLFFYSGFIFGTFLCGIAQSFEFLLAARMVTGVFGGVIGSIIFAITTDLFPMEMRGRVMGSIQTAFAASQIMGLPLGLYLANTWGWHAPFMMIVVGSILAGGIIVVYLPSITGHLNLKSEHTAFGHLVKTVSTPRYLQAFGTAALLSTGGFMLMPFGSAFSVNNLKIDLQHIPIIYMATGVYTIIAGPLIGRLCDRLGKLKVFMGGTILGILVVLFYTRLGETPISGVIFINILLFTGITARMISSSALMSGIPDPASRGSFMSVSSSVQQISGGIAAALAGLIVFQGSTGRIERYDMLGNVVAATMLITLLTMFYIAKMVSRTKQH